MRIETVHRLGERPWVRHYQAGVPPSLEYPEEPVYWLLEEAARRAPTRVACRYHDQQLTYAQLLSQSRRMAAVLRRRGLRPGERVALLLPNIPEFLIAAFGTWMAGGITVSLNPLLVADEIHDLLG